MWKKEDEPRTSAAGTSDLRVERRSGSGGGQAIIGPSISIRGDVTGSEDLLIQGEVDGSVNLDQHAVSVGGEGRVKANINGRVITVEGSVEGDLTAKEQIVLRGSAKVLGDIRAPRVVLEDGATFRGLVDMGGVGSKAKKEAISQESARPVDEAKGSNGGTDGKAAAGGESNAQKAARPGSGGKDKSSAEAAQAAP